MANQQNRTINKVRLETNNDNQINELIQGDLDLEQMFHQVKGHPTGEVVFRPMEVTIINDGTSYYFDSIKNETKVEKGFLSFYFGNRLISKIGFEAYLVGHKLKIEDQEIKEILKFSIISLEWGGTKFQRSDN
ncbi:MAG: hypothetical protein AAF433_00180 [Bacteroidota bacterium]